MIRIFTLSFGLVGAVTMSQFPEFSQQYLQRLGGAVDELTRVVDDFDTSSAKAGMTQAQALESLTDGTFQQARRADMTATIARHARLSADLLALRDATMLERVIQPQRFTDPDIVTAAWADFKPAVPVTVDGVGFAAIGFLAGVGGAFVLGLLFGRRPRPTPRSTPQITPHPVHKNARVTVHKGKTAQVSVMAIAPGELRKGQSPHNSDTVLICIEGRGQADGQDMDPNHPVIIAPGATYDIRNIGTGMLRVYAVDVLARPVLRADARPVSMIRPLTRPA